MLWVIIFVAIAVAGLVMVACYAVWLAHKTADVMNEVSVLADRSGQLGALLAQIELPSAQPDRHRASDLTTTGRTLHSVDIDVR